VKLGRAMKESPYLVIQVDTAFAAASTSGTAVFSLETYASDSFASARTVLWTKTFAASAKATLVAGYQVIKIPLPMDGMLRYNTVVCTTGGEDATGGTFSAFLVFEPDIAAAKA
jgi:hypothetical protein